jgi:hypothetical protein
MSDKPDFEKGQPAPKKNKGKSMHDLVRRDLAAINNGSIVQIESVRETMTALMERKNYGFEKYGTILQANNGRDALQDAFEEMMDLVVYLRQYLEEISSSFDSHGPMERLNMRMVTMVYQQSLQNLVMLQSVQSGRGGR